MGRVFQSPVGWLTAGTAWVGCLAAVLRVDGPDWSPRLDHPAIRHTALLSVAFWAVGSLSQLGLTPAGWTNPSARDRVAAFWVFGWLMFAAHVVAAFHLGHGWSHRAAFEEAARTAGVGEGVFVNYAFGLVWGLDAVWLAVWPDRYARRPRWVGRAVHGFLAFVTFNATVVYGNGLARWGGAGVFAALGGQMARSRRLY